MRGVAHSSLIVHQRSDPPWAATANSDTTSRAVPSLPGLPTYLDTSYTDPTYGTKVVRITGNPGTTNGVVTWGLCARHHYNLDQPWNCDESVLCLDTNSSQVSAWASGSYGASSSGGNVLCRNGSNVYQCVTAGSSTAAPTGTGSTINNGGTAAFKYLGTDAANPSSRLFLDGSTYAPLSYSGNSGGSYTVSEYRWSPTDPTKMYYTSSNRFGTWTPSTNAQTTITTLTGWSNLTFGNYKGFCDHTGNRWLLSGLNGSSVQSMVVYDIAQNALLPSSSGLPNTTNGSMISRNGNYLMYVDGSSDNIYIYDMTGTLVQTFAGASVEGNPSHFDQAINPATGNEAVVGRAHDYSGRPSVRDLVTATLTQLSVTSPACYLKHTSARSNFAGWAVSDGTGWATSYPLYQCEIIAYKLDASKVCRICYHFSPNAIANNGGSVEYYCDPQTTISPTGTRIMFGSTWSANAVGMNARPIYCFVADLR